MKPIIFAFTTTILFLTSCYHTETPDVRSLASDTHEKDSTNDELVETEIIESKRSLMQKKIEAIALSFHNWNINAINNNAPNDFEIVEGKSGKCKLDSSTYFKYLRKLGTVSERFICAEWDRVKTCSDFLNSLDWNDYTNSNAYEYDQYCDIYHYYWTRTQEPFHGVEVDDFKQNDDYYLVTLIFYHEYDDKSYSEFVKPVVKVEKEGEDWCITEIKWK